MWLRTDDILSMLIPDLGTIVGRAELTVGKRDIIFLAEVEEFNISEGVLHEI